METIPVKTLDYFHAQVSELYFHKQLKRLFIGSFERGVFVYDMNTQEIMRPEADLSDVNIARISPLNETELLIAIMKEWEYIRLMQILVNWNITLLLIIKVIMK